MLDNTTRFLQERMKLMFATIAGFILITANVIKVLIICRAIPGMFNKLVNIVNLPLIC